MEEALLKKNAPKQSLGARIIPIVGWKIYRYIECTLLRP
jgi:hypothetical protein